jgi:type II secretory pathway predicted ATPase ExeA
MYLNFYKIDQKPFELSADPSFLWMSEKHKEGLAVLTYGLQDKKGFILLTGDVGIGKTTLINAFINSLDSNVIFANITNPGLKRIEFYNLLGATFNFGGKFSGKDDFLIAFRAFLENSYQDGKQVLLIIDEAQRLSRGLLEEIRLLSNIERQSEKLLNIFIVGQDELNETLDRHENRALRQRMTLLYHLEPLSKNETAEYIQHRLHVAGTEKRIFTPKADREIYAFSGGYPRIINIICDHAMLTGYVKQKKTLDAPEIIECARELRLKKKLGPELSGEGQKGAARQKSIKTRSEKVRSISTYFAYAAAIIVVFFLVCFLYFPLKTGASFTGIMSYWKGQMFGSHRAESTQTLSVPSTQKTFKVIIEDDDEPGNLEAEKLRDEEKKASSDSQPGSPPAQ